MRNLCDTCHDMLCQMKKVEFEYDSEGDIVKCSGHSGLLMNWIPVTERLPQPGERVIAYWGAMAGEAWIGGGKWKRYDGRDIAEVFGCDVTYWMPFPELPKEGE